MKKVGETLLSVIRVASVVLLLPFTWLAGGVAHAATANSLYSFTLDGSTSSVANAAASNTSAHLGLVGNWNQSSYGVHFAGDLASKQSGGSYKPSSGNTLNAPSTNAVGAVIRFKYQAPASNNCFNDSPNITQIGRFQANTAQIKIQLSNCGTSSNNVYVECRMAGASTPSSVLPVRNNLALVNGGDYIATCYKTPDPASGNATVTLRVVKIDTLYGNTVENDNFSVAPTGAMTSQAYLSVANKFPMPAQSDNTDQFVGDVKKFSYCQATTTAAVSTCLGAEIPEPGLAPSVINTGLSGPTSLQVGQQGTYSLTVATSSGTPGSNGVASTLTVPANMSIVSATGATMSGQTAAWNLGDLPTGTTVNETAIITLNSGTVGDTATVSAATTTTNNACGTTGSTCTATYGTAIAAGAQPVIAMSFQSAPSTLTVGQQGEYLTNLALSGSPTGTTGAVTTVTVPSNMTIVSAPGATISGNTATWDWGNTLDHPESLSTDVSIRLDSGAAGDSLPVSLVTTSTDSACANSGSICSALTTAAVADANNAAVLTTSQTGPSSLQIGQQGAYTATTQNTANGSTATGVSTTITLPSNMSIISATGATVSGNTATWSNGSLAGGSSITNQLIAQLNTGNAGDTATVSAATTTTDSACTNAGSVCSSSLATSVNQLISNATLESGMTGWTGVYGPGSLVSTTWSAYGGHSGTHDILVAALSGASNASLGFNDSPRWVTNTDSTKTYSGKVWVRAGFAGQTINFRLREWHGSTLVTDNKITWTATDTDWHEMDNTITPAASGNQLAFAVYASGMNAGDSFEADDMSLTAN
ncbi:MAG TPA: hypothetical protein VLF91_00320 [Candidatus Saccharimonadales bacterium]|nr:hypothetical protein [Candidatus Saccharimonadales bacterium]